mgnify:CR=1 FL=1
MNPRGIVIELFEVMTIGVRAGAIALFAAGCGGEDAATPCEQVATKICEGACACSSKCAFGSNGGSIGFKSASSCEVGLTNSCDSTGGPMSIDKCLTALDTPTCMDGVLQLPAECN